MNIEGGNWRIFHHMILESRSKLRLDTPVIAIDEIDRDDAAAWRIYTDEGSQLFDGVVLASPFVRRSRSRLIAASLQYILKRAHLNTSSQLRDSPCHTYRDEIIYQPSILQRRLCPLRHRHDTSHQSVRCSHLHLTFVSQNSADWGNGIQNVLDGAHLG